MRGRVEGRGLGGVEMRRILKLNRSLRNDVFWPCLAGKDNRGIVFSGLFESSMVESYQYRAVAVAAGACSSGVCISYLQG